MLIVASPHHFEVNWGVVVPLVSAAAAAFAAVVGYLHNRRTDTITLYSSFVDDLHNEVTRLRSQYDEDRKEWGDERDRLVGQVRKLETENSGLRAARQAAPAKRPPRKRAQP